MEPKQHELNAFYLGKRRKDLINIFGMTIKCCLFKYLTTLFPSF